MKKPGSALVIAGHGSTINANSSTPTRRHAETLRARGIFDEVAVCFWKEDPPLREVLDTLESRDIYVVPNFISEGYFTREIIPREMQLEGKTTLRDGRVVKYCDPVGNHPHMTRLLLDQARTLAPELDPAQAALFIVGHGTALNDNSAVAAKVQAARIAALGHFAEVRNAYMEDTPEIAKWDRLTDLPNVIVVPFFIADGLHSYEDIPVLLGLAAEGDAPRDWSSASPHTLRGKRLWYGRAIGTAPAFAELILDQVAAFDAAQLTPTAR